MEGLKKLEELEARFGELSEQMADPALVQDQTAYRKIAKSHSDLSELVDKFQAWKSLQSESSPPARWSKRPTPRWPRWPATS